MTKTKKNLCIILAALMLCFIIPTAAMAEAGDWDPLTDPDDVAGSLAGNESFSASTSMQIGADGYLRMMPTLQIGQYEYNAMAYCGTTAQSSNTSLLEIKSIEIGAWQGGAWDGADALQVTVIPKATGRVTVTINFYYTFSQSASPLTNPNAQWFYGTMRYTVNITEPPAPNKPTDSAVQDLLGDNAVTVNCTNSEVAHADSSYALLNGSFTVGDVQGDASNGYTVGVTVAPDAYVTAYNTDVASGHSLSPASQSGTITLAYNAAAKVWEVQSGKPVTFTVVCETPVPTPTPTPDVTLAPTPKPEPETQYCYIEATAEGAGRNSPKGTIAVAEYDDQTFRMVAEPGSVLVDVLVDGVSAGAVSEYTFRSVTRDHTIHAVFQSVTPPTTGSDSAVVLGIALGLILAAGVVVFALRRRNES